ncbi:TetR/AcrR family transcriptional regulator [Nocardiopsis sp. MG754419]|uniref:TetR/AcrR family transcriptional regulator n=1 Tax=Nocardiopsis sp. MG754419 TaxID=2259865 RepID=UPI001BABBAEB|nr:TetR family transcriptional regulator C-terminal domain-containing protein [Nocardiopsis sp. MG754419]MBR8742341.1 TetR/AcrR family transcriptional regulator [Nocardiopsis sp. MG754419]
MPKVVDRQNRRRSVAEAIHRIAARGGLEEVSVRMVATEAGLSVGAVQRAFPTKNDLLRFALDTSVDEVAARFSRIRIGPELLTFAEGLRAVLVDLLPTDERRRAQIRIWAAYYARAAVDPEFAKVLADLDTRSRANLTAALTYARDQGELTSGQDIDALVELLMVIIDGLWLTCARLPEGTDLSGPRAAIDAAVALVSAR